MTDFYPTGKCFDDALDLLSEIIKKGRHLREKWLLVHALCRINGNTFAHAWCERDRKTVVTAFIIEGCHTYVEIPRRDFYRLFWPQELTRYSPWQAMQENFRTNHFGPWDARYRQHCGGKNKE